MLKVSLQKDGKTVLLELPLSHKDMVSKLSSVGITKSPKNMLCSDGANDGIRIKVYGDSEFEKMVADSVKPHNNLSSVNAFWELYQNMPHHAREDIVEKFLVADKQSLEVFGKLVLQSRISTTLEKYYCPLVVSVYSRDKYGDLIEEPTEYGGDYAAGIEDKIRDLIRNEDSRMDNDLADYFDGSCSAVDKLLSVKFSTQNVDGIVYGCIRVELTEKFTPEEDAEFKDWLEGQCSDGYGEGLEQRPIDVDGDEAYVSFWNSDDYYLLNEDEFDEFLIQNQSMGGLE